MEKDKREVKLIKEEIHFIGRYMGNISPKLARYQELKDRKNFLKEKLNLMGEKMDSKPEKLRKKI